MKRRLPSTTRDAPRATRPGIRDTPVARGSVLLLVLWTLFFLSALALAVAAYVGGGIELAGALKSDRIGYFAARAGVEQAITVVVCDSNGWDALTESWSNDEETFRDVAVGEGRFTVKWVGPHEKSGRKTRYGLSDEESRISLNSARTDRAVLRALLQRIGELDPAKALRIADAIVDWRDGDDQELTEGAENGYYQALPSAYKCHNGPLDCVEELLLVREVTPELFRALEPYVTVYGSGIVNINTAGRDVLATLGDAVAGKATPASDSLADRILAFREKGEVFERADVSGIVGVLQKSVGLQGAEALLLRRMLKYVGLKSTCYRGVVTGSRSVGPGRASDAEAPSGERTITFVFDRVERARLMWRED